MEALQNAALSEFDTDHAESTVEEAHAEMEKATVALVQHEPKEAETVGESVVMATVPMPSPQGDTAPVVGQAQVQQEATEPAATAMDGSKSATAEVGAVEQATAPAPAAQEAENESHQETDAGVTKGNKIDTSTLPEPETAAAAPAPAMQEVEKESHQETDAGVTKGSKIDTSTLPEPETAAAAPAPAMQEVEKESHQETVGQAAAPAPTVQEPKKDDDDVEAEGDGDDKDSSMSSSTSSDDESAEATGGRIILFFVFNPANIQLHLWLVFFLTRKDLRLRAKRTRL